MHRTHLNHAAHWDKPLDLAFFVWLDFAQTSARVAPEKTIRYRPAVGFFVTTTDNVRYMMLLKPRNWDKFQHYKDRCPPWIKLHRDLLNDREFACLPLASKALAPLLWLLASESKDGSFDATVDELVFRLRLKASDVEVGLKSLIEKGFFIYASNTLAECLQVAIPETERERETETKKEKKTTAVAAPPEGVSQSLWGDFLALRKAKKAPMTNAALAGIMREADRAGWTLEKALTECCARGWQGFKAEWVAVQKPTDIVRMTVPSSPERDPALVKIDRDAAHRAPVPQDIKAKLQSIIKKVG